MATHSVFYSWQIDRPNSTNRGFIEDCLERAIKEIHADEQFSIEPCLERDTAGTTGTPDIAATIFDKIGSADVFVGDVTFIDDGRTLLRRLAAMIKGALGKGKLARRAPNPNVLVELGYAAACLKWDKVICVFNEAYGEIEDLPFDIRSRRVLAYRLVKGQEKADVRKQLVARLKSDIAAVCGKRWANVQISGSYSRNDRGETGITFTVTNSGSEELPPYNLVIRHPKIGALQFRSKESGSLLPHQKRSHFFGVTDSCTPTGPFPAAVYGSFKVGTIDKKPLTLQDETDFAIRLMLEHSEKVLFENRRIARAFVKVVRLMLDSGGAVSGTWTDWHEMNSSLPDE